MKNLRSVLLWTPRVLEILIGAAVLFLPVSKAAAEVFFITALACWLLNMALSRSAPSPDPGIIFLYGIFLAITLASLSQVPPQLSSEGLRGALKWLKYLGVFFMCLDTYRTPSQQLRLARVFLISMVIVSLDGFFQLYTGKDLFLGRELDPGRIIRMKASLGAPNLLAGFLILAVPLSVFFFYKSRSWLRALWGTGFLLFLSAFFLTYSRGAFYGMVLSLVLNLVFMKKIRTTLITVACLALLVLAVPSLRYNFVKTLARGDITIMERSDYWDVAFNMIQSHPLLGVGVNTYHARFPDYAADPAVRRAYPHNSYLQMTSEIGVPGALVFLLAIFYLWGRSWGTVAAGQPGLLAALRIALTAFLIQGFADNNLYALQTAYLFWMFWGMFAALVFREKEISPA